MHERFDRFAKQIAWGSGHAGAFIGSTLACLLWAVSGPLFGWSDTWQLVINTSTTVLTFLMVFVIQNTQNRDTAEIKAMLHELVQKLPGPDERGVQQRINEGEK